MSECEDLPIEAVPVGPATSVPVLVRVRVVRGAVRSWRDREEIYALLATLFPSASPFFPLISALTGFHDRGLVTGWALLLITSNYLHHKIEVG